MWSTVCFGATVYHRLVLVLFTFHYSLANTTLALLHGLTLVSWHLWVLLRNIYWLSLRSVHARSSLSPSHFQFGRLVPSVQWAVETATSRSQFKYHLQEKVCPKAQNSTVIILTAFSLLSGRWVSEVTSALVLMPLLSIATEGWLYICMRSSPLFAEILSCLTFYNLNILNSYCVRLQTKAWAWSQCCPKGVSSGYIWFNWLPTEWNLMHGRKRIFHCGQLWRKGEMSGNNDRKSIQE